jgi:hypothetical protein
MTALVLVRVVAWFPLAPNHTYLALYCSALIAACWGRGAEGARLATFGLRWCTLIVLISSGLQKWLRGRSRSEAFFDGLVEGLEVVANERVECGALDVAALVVEARIA